MPKLEQKKILDVHGIKEEFRFSSGHGKENGKERIKFYVSKNKNVLIVIESNGIEASYVYYLGNLKHSVTLAEEMYRFLQKQERRIK